MFNCFARHQRYHEIKKWRAWRDAINRVNERLDYLTDSDDADDVMTRREQNILAMQLSSDHFRLCTSQPPKPERKGRLK